MDFHRKVREYHIFCMGGVNSVVKARWNACQVMLVSSDVENPYLP